MMGTCSQIFHVFVWLRYTVIVSGIARVCILSLIPNLSSRDKSQVDSCWTQLGGWKGIRNHLFSDELVLLDLPHSGSRQEEPDL